MTAVVTCGAPGRHRSRTFPASTRGAGPVPQELNP